MHRKNKWAGSVIFTLMMCTVSAPVVAQAGNEITSPASLPAQDEATSTTDTVIESTRQSVRSTAEWLASGIDRQFGNKPFTEGGTITDGQIGLSYLKRDQRGSNLNLRFNARFKLPNLEKVPYLFIGNGDERSIITDQPDRKTLREQIRQRNSNDNSFFAGLGIWLADSVDIRLGFRGLFRPYLQARLGHEWQLTSSDSIEIRETVFYTIHDRAGSTLAAEFQHVIMPTLVMRWLNAATITQHQPNLALTSNLGLYQSFGEQRVLGLEAQFSDSKIAGISTNDIGLQISWEQPLHKVILGELSVGKYWPRSSDKPDRTGQWAAGATIGLKF